MKEQKVKSAGDNITFKDLDLLKKELKLWTVGLMISSFVLFAGFITFLDNKTQKRLDRMADRLDRMDQKMSDRFQTIEKDIKTILLILSPNQLNTKANIKSSPPAGNAREISQN